MAAFQMEESRQVSMKIAIVDDDILCLSPLAQMEALDHRKHRHLYAFMSTMETPPSAAVLNSTRLLAIAFNASMVWASILALWFRP